MPATDIFVGFMSFLGVGRTVNRRWTHDHRPDYIRMCSSSIKHDLVDVTMKRPVRQARQVRDAGQIVIFLVRPGAQLGEVVVGILVRQDPRAARVQPIAWVVLRVAGCQTSGDGFGRALVVGSVCCVCNEATMDVRLALFMVMILNGQREDGVVFQTDQRWKRDEVMMVDTYE